MKDLLHLSDNLFYLYEITKTLNTATELELTPEMIDRKVLSDIKFVFHSLNDIATALFDSPHNRHKLGNTRSLLKNVCAFKETLERINSAFTSRHDISKLQDILYTCEDFTKKLDELIQVITQLIENYDPKAQDTNFISTEEMSLLFVDEI